MCAPPIKWVIRGAILGKWVWFSGNGCGQPPGSAPGAVVAMVLNCHGNMCRDDDMQSTFSAMSAGQESTAYDEEDEDEEEEEEQIALTTAATSTTPVPEG